MRRAATGGLCGVHMAKEELLEFPGVVKELLPNATFRVELENGHEIIAHTAGRCARTASASSQATAYRSR